MEQPKALFRYRPSSQYSIDAFLEGKTYATCPSELNDALDSSISFDVDKLVNRLLKSNKMVAAAKRSLFYRFTKKIDDFGSHEDYEKEIDKCQARADAEFNDEKSKTKIRDYMISVAANAIDSFRKSFAVVSFSTNGFTQIMWSHYASDSSGFVLVYDFEKLSKDFSAWINSKLSGYNEFQRSVFGLHKVKYLDVGVDGTDFLHKTIMKRRCKRETDESLIKDVANEVDAKFILSLLTEKKTEWSYEGEYRLILPFDAFMSDPALSNTINDEIGQSSKNIYYFNIGDVEPVAVFIGKKMSLVNRVAIASYCNLHKLALYKEDISALQSFGHIGLKLISLDGILAQPKRR